MHELLASTLCLVLLACPAAAQQDEWWSWRGMDGRGVAPDADPPLQWSETQNIRWKVEVPGLAYSSPIVLGERVYLTTAIETDRTADATNVEPHNPRSKAPPTSVYEFAVIALDRGSGGIAWRTTLFEGVPHEGGHASNSQASSSPVTDGEQIYVNLGSRGLFCLDLDGKLRWSRDLGLMRTRYQYGEGSSPAVHDDYLVVNRDQEGDSFLAVFDKRTGEELWRRSRDEATSWTTPLVVPVGDNPQVVTSAYRASRGYDLANGELLWTLSGMTELCIPSPMHAGGMVYLMSGYPGSAVQAVRLEGAAADLAGGENVVWTHHANAPYVSSGALHDDLLYFVRVVNGVLSCLDARTGEVYYEGQRLGVRRVLSSLVGAGGRIYVTSQEGVTKVVRHGRVFDELATNRLDDNFDASPAIAGDELYLRGHRFLYCIAEG